MLVIGLTGGIGSGKSEVATRFEACGIEVIDTDEISRELVEPNKPALNQIINRYGNDILLNDNTLDRTQLRNIIFDDPKERHWLEALLHPLIRDKIEKIVTQTHSPYCIIVVPLLFEAKFNHDVDRILVVDCQEALQIERTCSRDAIEKDAVQTIMDTQIDRSERLEKADDIVVNDGELKELDQKVSELHEMYLRLSSV